MNKKLNPPPSTLSLKHPLDNAVLLQRKNGETVTLTAERLKEWCERHDPLKRIQRFGFSKPNDIMVFLNSPGGSIVKKLIGSQLAEIAALKDYKQLYQNEEALKKERQLLHLLLGLAHKREDKKLLEDDYVDALALIQKNKEIFEKNNLELAAYSSFDFYNLEENDYGETLNSLLSETSTLEEESGQIKREQAALEAEIKQGLKWYNDLENTVSGVEDFLNPYTTSGQDKAVLMEEIAEKIKSHEASIQEKSLSVARAIENNANQDGGFRAAMEDLKRLNLELESLKALQEVTKGNKAFYNLDGKQVHSLQEAQIMVSKGKQLLKENGVCYIVDSNKKSPLNQQDKSEGRLAFNKSEHENLNLQNLVKSHRQSYEKSLAQQQNKLAMQLENINDKRLVISNQLLAVQSLQKKEIIGIAIKNELQNMHKDPEKTQLKVMAIQKEVRNVFGETQESKHFLQQLDKLKQSPKPTPDQITNAQKAFDKIITNQKAIREDSPQISNERNKYTRP